MKNKVIRGVLAAACVTTAVSAANVFGAGTEQYLALGRGIRTFCADQRRSSCADLVDMRCHGRSLRRDDDGELSGARAVHDFIDDGRGYKRRNKSI